MRRANFKSKKHTRKHTLASVLIDSEVRRSQPQALANFGIGTLAPPERRRQGRGSSGAGSTLCQNCIIPVGEPSYLTLTTTCSDHSLLLKRRKTIAPRGTSREAAVMKFKHQLMLSSALLASAIGTSTFAQTRTGTSAAATNTIEELVITAEKRAQSLQDVPVAVTAFTDAKRELVGINSIQDMTNFTPGLEYNSSTDRISLRGVGRLTNVLTADSSVANYNDGIYETFAVQAGRSTLFLDRVEILRGPHVTLYGRNAIGRAINCVAKRPPQQPNGEIR